MKRTYCTTLMITAMLLFLATALAQRKQEQQDSKENKIISYFPTSTGKPTIPDKYKVTSVEQLLPGTRYYLEHGTNLQKGEQLLIVDDSRTGDPLITQAWAQAARERGAIVDVVTLDLTSHRAK